MSRTPSSHPSGNRPSWIAGIVAAAALLAPAASHAQIGHSDRALLNPVGVTGGRTASTISPGGEATAAPSSFRAEVRTDVVNRLSGEAEFGAAGTADSSPAAFVISLGVSSPHGAILFTRMSGTPLQVGRYRVSERATDADEILALVITGGPTRPTGVYRGRSGWLVVTAASGANVTGRFEVDGVGFPAKEPSREDRPLSATGWFSAGLASASLRKSEDGK